MLRFSTDGNHEMLGRRRLSTGDIQQYQSHNQRGRDQATEMLFDPAFAHRRVLFARRPTRIRAAFVRITVRRNCGRRGGTFRRALSALGSLRRLQFPCLVSFTPSSVTSLPRVATLSRPGLAITSLSRLAILTLTFFAILSVARRAFLALTLRADLTRSFLAILSDAFRVSLARPFLAILPSALVAFQSRPLLSCSPGSLLSSFQLRLFTCRPGSFFEVPPNPLLTRGPLTEVLCATPFRFSTQLP